MSDDKIDANRAAIAACIADGMKIADIAARIGLRAVEVRAYTYVFNLQTPDTVRAEEIARRFKAGDTLETIGADYGISRERVRQILKKTGMTGKDGGNSQRLRARRAAKEQAREAAFLAKHGCTLAQYRGLKRIGEEMIAAGHGKYETPLYAFQGSRKSVKQTGVGFNLTLWEWWQAWQQAGVWEQRGTGHGYGMTRIDKTKPYEVGNLRFETGDERMANAIKAYHASDTMEAA